mmetsp:Transcript_22679/g.40723  ORF Transcript_22679/g.40723 Transcript_22679/m.40723 type:complete len:200 (+) Transcript_22679:2091-2690(+)
MQLEASQWHFQCVGLDGWLHPLLSVSGSVPCSSLGWGLSSVPAIVLSRRRLPAAIIGCVPVLILHLFRLIRTRLVPLLLLLRLLPVSLLPDLLLRRGLPGCPLPQRFGPSGCPAGPGFRGRRGGTFLGRWPLSLGLGCGLRFLGVGWRILSGPLLRPCLYGGTRFCSGAVCLPLRLRFGFLTLVKFLLIRHPFERLWEE